MRLIQNSNIAFRCPDALKEKLEAYANEVDMHVSAIIRAACVAFLKGKALDMIEEKRSRNRVMSRKK